MSKGKRIDTSDWNGKHFGYWKVVGESKVIKQLQCVPCICTHCNTTERYLAASKLKCGRTTMCLRCISGVGGEANAEKSLIDLSGKTFGYWVVLPEHKLDNSGKKTLWLCHCTICGTRNYVLSASLRNGSSTRCNTCAKEAAGKTRSTHNMSHSKLYAVHTSILQRCFNENDTSFRYYGGRGITLADDLLRFEDFMEFALSNGYEEGLETHRPDNDNSYTKTNIEWITPELHRQIHADDGRRFYNKGK